MSLGSSWEKKRCLSIMLILNKMCIKRHCSMLYFERYRYQSNIFHEKPTQILMKKKKYNNPDICLMICTQLFIYICQNMQSILIGCKVQSSNVIEMHAKSSVSKLTNFKTKYICFSNFKQCLFIVYILIK